MTRDDLIEALAAMEHQRWADWQKWVHQTCGPDPTHSGRGALLILPENVARWERQIATSYAELSEQEKQSDRDQVARYWPLIVAFVAARLSQQSTYSVAPAMPDVWRMEMER